MPYGRNDRDFPSRDHDDDRQRLNGRWMQDDETGHLRRRFDDEGQSYDAYPGGRDSSGYDDRRSSDRFEGYYGGSGRRVERVGGGHAFDFARRDSGRSDLSDRGGSFEGPNRFGDRGGYDSRWDRDYDDRATRQVSNGSPRREETGDRISRYGSTDERSDRERAGSFRGKGPKGYVRSDERIKEDVSDRLTDDDTLDASDIMVDVSSGEVTLSGFVDSRQAKRTAEECADECAGVTHVQNNLRVRTSSGQTSSAGTGSSGSTDL